MNPGPFVLKYTSTELKIPKYPDYFDRPDNSKEFNHLQNFINQSKNVTGSQRQLITDTNTITPGNQLNSVRYSNGSPKAI